MRRHLIHPWPTLWLRRAPTASPWPAGSTACHAFDHERGCCGSHAAALQTPRHGHDERARHPIQRAMALEIVVSPPRCHTSSLAAE